MPNPTETEVQSALTTPAAYPTVTAPPSTSGFTPSVSGPVPVDQTAPQSPLNLASTVTTPNTSTADATVSTAPITDKSVSDYIASFTPATTPADKQNQAILDSITQLTGDEGKKGADQAQAEADKGIPGMQTTLQNLNNELALKTAQYNKQFTQLGGNGSVETSAVFNAQSAGLKMAQAADIGIVQAKISAAQGNLTLAQDQVNRAIDLKYSTIEAQLATKQAQLAALQPQLEKEKTAAGLAAQQRSIDLQHKYEQEQQKIADEKQKVKDNLNLVLQSGAKTPVVNNNGNFFDAKTGQIYSTPEAFYKAMGVKSFEEAYQKGLVTDVNGSTLADRNLVAQAAAKYPDAGINPNDSVDIMKAKLAGSAIYRKETYIAPPAGTGPGYGPNGGNTIDLSKYTDQNAPQDELGGLSANGLLNAAKLYLADNGKMPSLGLGSKASTEAKRNAIINLGGQLAQSMGLDLPQISALYKANSKAAGTIIDRVAKIDTTSATLVSQFPRLSQLAAEVGNLGITEQDISAGKAAAERKFGSVAAANYIELVQTIRGDYSALQASLSGGRGGQYFVANAKDAIPLGLTPDQYQGLADTIQMSAVNAKNATATEATKIINNYTSAAGGTDNGTDSGSSADAGKIVVQDKKGNQFTVTSDQLQEAIKSGYTFVKKLTQ